jgi:hypothetical protein
MTHSLRMFASIALLILAPTTAFAFATIVDTTAQTVRVDFAGLTAYEQIRLEGVDGLFWCACLDPDNPSSLSSTGFTVNGGNLEMQYEGSTPPPSTNYITYHYLDGYAFTGYEPVEWVLVSGADETRLTGNRPVLVLVPEPSTAMLWLVGLALMSPTRRDA